MPVDLLTAVRPDEELHPQFLSLRDSPLHEPARGMLHELQEEFHDPDGNFVEQFQTTGFDSRTFELFLFAMFRKSGHTIDRSEARPDFMLAKEGIAAAVEAVTANPPPTGVPQPYAALPGGRTEEEQAEYLRNEVAIRLGSPLFSKLNQKYWDLPHVKEKPLVIAIQNFQSPGSLTISATPLAQYLFGMGQHWYHDAEGRLIITAEPIATHRIGAKEIPSGFFNQSGAENISGVLFSNAGTIPKFNRMGHEGAYHSPAVRMLRYGTCYRHNPNAARPDVFLYEVGDPAEGRETWREGTHLIRNPRALWPLPDAWLGAAAEQNLRGGQVVVTHREPFLPFMSITENFPGNISDRVMQSRADGLVEHLQQLFPN